MAVAAKKRPVDHQGLFGIIFRPKVAVAAGNIQRHRQRFRQGQIALCQAGNLAQRMDGQIFGRRGVQRGIGGLWIGQPVRLNDRNMGERLA